MMGYRTPNIDRIAREGMMFTDAYGEQSCTAGRSSFITGQSVYDWFLHNAYFIYVAQTCAAKFAETFKEFPPAQKAATFTVDQALAEDERGRERRRELRSVPDTTAWWHAALAPPPN